MKTICLYFEIHQFFHLKRYHIIDIGKDHYYYDDYENERSITDIANRSYVPALNTLIQMVKENDDFKVALSLSGVGLELLELYSPWVISLLQELNQTGKVEFLCEPYSHGLASLANEKSFEKECMRMKDRIKELFGKTPKVFCNSSLIYNDKIGAQVAAMGFKGILTEGAKHILGWKSPHFVYSNTINQNIKLLLRDNNLSEYISQRFADPEWSEYPLFADTYMDWIAALPEEEEIINICMELSTLGIYQPLSSNILEFIKALPACAKARRITWATPTGLCTKVKPVAPLNIPNNISWVDEERDTSCWLGNVMQRDVIHKLYSIADRIHTCDDRRLKQDWDYLQASNNFRFMTTKQKNMAMYRGIYVSPFDAFINYMNILDDFISRVNNVCSQEAEKEKIKSNSTDISGKETEDTPKAYSNENDGMNDKYTVIGKFCIRCGYKNNNAYRFCAKCGQMLGEFIHLDLI